MPHSQKLNKTMTKFETALTEAQNDTRPRAITKDTYRKYWRIFADWCEENGHECYPPSYKTIGAYLRYVDKVEGRKAGTLRSKFAAITWQIKCFSKVPEECRPESLVGFTLKDSPIPEAREILDTVISEMEQEEPKRARGITVEELAQIFRNDTKQRDYGVRQESREHARTRAKTDRALFLTLFNGLLRGSEGANVRWGDIEIYPDGSGDLFVRYSKTSGKRRTRNRYLTPECVEALNAIRPKDGYDPDDYVFTERKENGNVKPICRRTITKRIKAAAQHAGIRGWQEYSSHSFRVGGAMHLYHGDGNGNKATLAEIADCGDWTTTETILGYVRAGNREKSAVKRLMSGRIAA